MFYLAENGNQQAKEALLEVYAEYRQRRENPPITVEAYAIQSLKPGHKDKKPGPGKAANFARDVGIALLGWELNQKFGLAFYKNSGSRGPTVGTVAAPELNKAGIGVSMGPAGVERIWRRFGPICDRAIQENLSRSLYRS